MNIAPHYDLLESFISTNRKTGPSFDFLFNINSRNLYHASLDGRFYTFHFLVGFLTTLARSRSLKDKFAIEKIVLSTGKTRELENDPEEYFSSTDEDQSIDLDFQSSRDNMKQRSSFLKCFILKQNEILVRNFFFDFDDLTNIKKYDLPRMISKSEIKKLATIIHMDFGHLETFGIDVDEFAVTFSKIFNDQELEKAKIRSLPSPEIRLGQKFATAAKFYPDMRQESNQFVELDQDNFLLDHLSERMLNTDVEHAQERTMAFFGTMNNIFDEIYADLNVKPLYGGSESGFAHGMFSALASKHPIKVNVEYTENFDLTSYVVILEHRMDILNDGILEKVPLIATFCSRFPENMNILEESHSKDTLSKAKVFVTADFKSKRIMMYTKKNKVRGQGNFLEKLASSYDSSMNSEEYIDEIHKLTEFIITEMNKIRLTTVMQNVQETNYFSRYLLGMFHAMEDYKYKVFLMNEPDQTVATKFFITGSKMKVILDIREYPINHARQSVQRQSSSKIPEADIMHLTISMQYEHSTHNFLHPNDHDLRYFIFPSINIDFKKSVESEMENLLQIRPTRFASLIEQDFSAEAMHKKFHSILNNNLQYLKTRQDYAAFIEGLFHFSPSIKNALQIQPYYTSDIIMTLMSGDKNLGESSTSRQLHRKLKTINFDIGGYENKERMSNEINSANVGNERKSKLGFAEHAQSKRMKLNDERVIHDEEKNFMTSLTEHKTVDSATEIVFYDFKVNVNLDTCGPRRKRSVLCEIKSSAHADSHSYSVKLQNHLNILEKASSGIMIGLMVRDFTNHLLQKNWKGLLEDSAFISLMGISSAVSHKSQQIASNLLQSGRIAASKLSRFGGAVASKALSFYVIKHLIDSIKSYTKGVDDSLVDVTTDGLFLASEVAQLTVEGMEICGLVEGIASITGPIGLALGTISIVGAQIYHAVNRIESVAKEISMTTYQKVMEGLSTFFTSSDSSYVKNEMTAKRVNDYEMRLALSILHNQPNIKRVVVQSARMLNNRILLNEDNYIDFVNRRNVSIRAITTPMTTSKIFCHSGVEYRHSKEYVSYFLFHMPWPFLFSGNSDGQVAHNTFLCKNSFGLEETSKTHATATFYDLGSGEDVVLGFRNSSNYFDLGGGRKIISGGDHQDLFILRNCSIAGTFAGLGSVNDVLILSSEFCKGESVKLTAESVFQNKRKRITIGGIENYVGRNLSQDMIIADCSMSSIDLQGGENSKNKDLIFIPLINCSYELNIQFHSNTAILSVGSGIFYYILHTHLLSIMIRNSTPTTIHNFIITSKISDLISVSLLTQQSEKVHCIRICVRPKKCSSINVDKIRTLNHINLYFKDDSRLLFTEGRPTILIKSNHSIEKCIIHYRHLLRLNASLIIVSGNESLISSSVSEKSGDHLNVVHNDPTRSSHIICSQKKSVILIQSQEDLKLNLISIYTSTDVKQITIDLSLIHHQIRTLCGSCDLRLKMLTFEANIEVEVFLIEEIIRKKIVKILLVDGILFFKQFYIINAGRLKIYSKPNGNFLLLPEPIDYDSETAEIIILHPDQVECNQVVRVARIASKFSYYKQNESNLIITNLVDHLFFHESLYCTIVIEEFFAREKMRTLKIDFNEGEMILNLEKMGLNVNQTDDIARLFEILYSKNNIFH